MLRLGLDGLWVVDFHTVVGVRHYCVLFRWLRRRLSVKNDDDENRFLSSLLCTPPYRASPPGGEAQMQANKRVKQRQTRLLLATVTAHEYAAMDADNDNRVSLMEFMVHTLIKQVSQRSTPAGCGPPRLGIGAQSPRKTPLALLFRHPSPTSP